MNKAPEAKPVVTQDRRGRKRTTAKKNAPLWSNTQSLTVRAMALAGDRLAVAGPPEVGKKSEGVLSFDNQEEALAAFQGRGDAFLRIVSAEDGETIHQHQLAAMPVFDGLATAGGKIYVGLQDGSVVCLGK